MRVAPPLQTQTPTARLLQALREKEVLTRCAPPPQEWEAPSLAWELPGEQAARKQAEQLQEL